MAEPIRERREGAQQRPFGRTYIEMRRVVEDRLRRQFIALGGRPERRAPHHFVLGESPWFRGLAVDMEEIRIPVSKLPARRPPSRPGPGRSVLRSTATGDGRQRL